MRARGSGPPPILRGRLPGLLLESGVAVLAVSLFVGVLLGWFGQPSAALRPSPSPTATTATPARTPEGTRSPVAAPDVTASLPVLDAKAPVAVLNATSIDGLAGRTAERLRDLGWTVPVVDDYEGEVGASTVFHPAGLEAAARLLAEAVGVRAVRPAPSEFSGKRLTVVLTAEPRVAD